MRAPLVLPVWLLTGLTATAADAAGDAPMVGGTSWLAWGLGLLCGIALMVFTTVEWRRLPDLALVWLKHQRRNAGWAALGAASIAVLALY